ncbi:GNAT family N-acetyltransferase [Colwellia psychrerythraea]|uniref:GCN5-related N-acetyltransferase n=1 Tax=Colwellia psychrerythraea TaxID=28229 RepID=A0A099KB63_COLPS|nr:GNAT family N-acetyltransferase [Colwellia psychrerythraea]KGJ87530.1 GCN5-related N-acetyltransferase [Colwellia psychrerythraea]
MLTIRKFQSGDESALRDIFFNTIRNVNIKDYSEVQVQAWAPDDYDQSDWHERISSINPLVAVLDSEIVGYADIQDDGYIDHFFCHWNHQGKGIGKALIQELFAVGQKKGMNRLYSHASITAKPFFEHFGFKKVKKQQVKIRGQVLTNYIMEKVV